MGSGEEAADNGADRGDQHGGLDALGNQPLTHDLRALHFISADDIGLDGPGMDDAVATDRFRPKAVRDPQAAPHNEPVGRQPLILDGLSPGDVNGFHIDLLLF